MRRIWYRIRPYVLGDLVADVRMVRDENGIQRALPGHTYRVRRPIRRRAA